MLGVLDHDVVRGGVLEHRLEAVCHRKRPADAI